MIDRSIRSIFLNSFIAVCTLLSVNILVPNSIAYSEELLSTETLNRGTINKLTNILSTQLAETGEVDIPDPRGATTLDGGGSENSVEPIPETTDLIENTNKPAPSPAVLTDLNALPFPARKMHELILEAARSGDIEKLRPFIGKGDDVTMLSLGGFNEDPIEFLKSISGDAEGHELLAIITEILEADFVLIDEGTDREVYVWPYFYAYSLEKLTPRQRVKLFRLLTYGDYQEMQSFGAYIFYRLGITPQGRWRFFVAGD